MRNLFICITLLYSSFIWSLDIGEKVQNFELLNEHGKKVSLKNFAGKNIVLEWLNHGCPFIKKHYSVNNMQKTQAYAKSKGFVWLSIISSAKGKQGHSDPAKALADMKRVKSNADHVLLDFDGAVGQMFEAKTTPHMFILSKDSLLLYQGAIDSISSADPGDIPKAENYIKSAITAIDKSKEIIPSKTRPYGCSVKY